MPGNQRDSRFCKEKLARLFECSLATKKQGEGIGLSICETISKRGGRLATADRLFFWRSMLALLTSLNA